MPRSESLWVNSSCQRLAVSISILPARKIDGFIVVTIPGALTSLNFEFIVTSVQLTGQISVDWLMKVNEDE
jgi:hypothetical protein